MKQDRPTTGCQPPLRVLYDGGCPLCRREIALYQRLQPRRPLEWIDIHADQGAPARFGISLEEAMARFHVLEGTQIRTGAAAFLLLWSAMPGWRHLAGIVRALRLQGLLERGYVWFARRRIRQGCTEDSCGIPPADVEAGSQ
ncbi:DUF393 domain-containing protein [Thiorhodococcus mannitoliphagus]|uniref:DUF393 domain-containing protein n=1 Tax=Thiorhodococcus mannitoliphagus TaxID=329406 RepID=A0A6P1DVQ7_9GAMM|nr:DUF393 domain-containing protein [Thiorhodococcus mannitoliphagus]NEX22427.1 DUF393 domain-containing protein [Thiorhodococcus mannitoliphagus]